jgi:hypothetical protein
MQLNIPPPESEKLARQASAAGFANVEQYVTQFVLTLADRSDQNQVLPPAPDDDLAASLAMIDQGMAEIDAGKGLSVDEARRSAHDNLVASDE